MARPIKTRGFTLVELLVVITIIGMLVSLLLPAIQAAREAGRRTTCSNNMRNVALGLIQSAELKKGFSPYVTAITRSGAAAADPPVFVRASWVISILPALERNDLYQNWNNSKLPTAFIDGTNPREMYITPLAILQCPSNANPDLGDNPLSYGINTGSAVTANDTPLGVVGTPYPSDMKFAHEDSNSGVSFDGAQWGSGAPAGNGKRVTLDFINTNDGTTNTILISENLQSGGWGLSPVANGYYGTDAEVRQNTGIVFFITGNVDNAGPPSVSLTSTTFDPGAVGINDKAQLMVGPITRLYSSMPDTESKPGGLAYSRPSGNHNGGVNTYFCGGNQRYLVDEMDYKVYTQLMTPNQKAISTKPETDSLVTPKRPGVGVTGAWVYSLNEADLN